MTMCSASILLVRAVPCPLCYTLLRPVQAPRAMLPIEYVEFVVEYDLGSYVTPDCSPSHSLSGSNQSVRGWIVNMHPKSLGIVGVT
jgi:hypothetical protein